MNLPSNNLFFNKKDEGSFDNIKNLKTIAQPSLDNANIHVKRFPNPYQAILAICSDLDETPDKNVYFETMRFLNTNEETTMGRGVGLEVGNTIYFDMPPNQFAYWNTDDTGRTLVREFIRSGHIDCLHSYGDLATTREHAARALDELDRHNCKLKVWVDHGAAPTNFDGDIMKGSGDVIGSPAYHADLTIASGVEYVWRGRVTSIIGQNVQRHYKGIWNASHPFCSSKTLLKEITKGLLGQYGNKKYAMHAPNRILQTINLRDGQQIFEFMRCNPHWGGVSSCETASGINEVLTSTFLDTLVANQAACILYTHLGKTPSQEGVLPKESRQAFFRLSSYVAEEKILVTTTYRLLTYYRMLEEAHLHVKEIDDKIVVDIQYTGPKEDLDGLTFQLPRPRYVIISHNGRELNLKQFKIVDNEDLFTVSLPWHPLDFPQE